MKIDDIVENLYHKNLKPLPAREIELTEEVTIVIKLEYPIDFTVDPLRTIKRKPASLLLYDLLEKGYIRVSKKLITASSGNFLRELALRALELNLKIIGVTPPIIPRENLKILTALGVDIVHVSKEYDLCPRETTVFFTRALAEKYHLQLVNIDQYYSWQNVLSHLFMTWREIREAGDIDYICVPLGSTGTFMGICLGSQMEKDSAKVVGIQPTRVHHIPGVHYIVGDCEWSPEIFSPLLNREIVTVDDIDAYAGLIKLWENGVYAGPSTGMTFIYSLKLADRIRSGRILVISADSVFAYRDYILNRLKEIRLNIIKRYPSLAASLNKYVEWLQRQPNLEERVELIRKIYKPSVGEGRVYEVPDVMSAELPF